MKILMNEEVNREKWNEFVAANSRGNVFQSYDMYDIYMQTKNYEPMLLAVVDDDDKICAGLLASIIWEPKLKLFSSRSILKGGPLWNNDKALNFLLEEYDKIIKTKALYSEIRNIFDLSDIKELLQNKNWRFEGELNFLINLKSGKDILWKNLTKARRNGVTKAKRLGVSIKELIDKKEIDKVYHMLEETYKQAKWPLADKSLFESAFDILAAKKFAKFFLAKKDSLPLGVIFVITDNKLVYDWYAGASSEHLKLCANDLLAWHAIEWSAQNGFEVFDFGGAGDPDKPYGVRDFKEQFGGELVNYGRHKKIHQPLKMIIAKIGFKIYRRIFK